MSFNKGIFTVLKIVFITGTIAACKLEIKTLCETVKADLGNILAPPELSTKCTCDANKLVCDQLNQGAPYNFTALCPVVMKAFKVPDSLIQLCNCDTFGKTCMKIDECNAAHSNSTSKNGTVDIMASVSAMTDASSTIMMATSSLPIMKTMETMTSLSPSSSMTGDKTPKPEPTESSTSMMMMSSSSIATNGTNGAANQIQVGRLAVALGTTVAGLFFYLM